MSILKSDSDSPPAKETIHSGSGNESGENWASYDEMDMARMGKKQELKRTFSWLSSIGFTSCTMGT